MLARHGQPGMGCQPADDGVLPGNDLQQGIHLALQDRLILLQHADLCTDVHHGLGHIRVGARVAAAAEREDEEKRQNASHGVWSGDTRKSLLRGGCTRCAVGIRRA